MSTRPLARSVPPSQVIGEPTLDRAVRRSFGIDTGFEPAHVNLDRHSRPPPRCGGLRIAHKGRHLHMSNSQRQQDAALIRTNTFDATVQFHLPVLLFSNSSRAFPL